MANAQVAELPVAEVSEDEVLAMFTEVMRVWGHYRTAGGLRYPTRSECRKALLASRYSSGSGLRLAE